MQQSEIRPLALDFFSGGIPAGVSFGMVLRDLQFVSDLNILPSVNCIPAVLFVGLVSYLEAFCKDHAASIVSIAPTLLDKLRNAGRDTNIDAKKVLQLGSLLPAKLGFLIMESYDFGTAKNINAIFSCLLKITPFSKNEAEKYNSILRDRNLVVHHGSIYTTRYLEQTGADPAKITEAFQNQLEISPEQVRDTTKLLESIAKKLVHSSHSALVQYIEETKITLDTEYNKP